jgi:hypothetical protein
MEKIKKDGIKKLHIPGLDLNDIFSGPVLDVIENLVGPEDSVIEADLRLVKSFLRKWDLTITYKPLEDMTYDEFKDSREYGDSERRMLAMSGIKSAIQFAREEGSDIPLSTIAVVIAESLEDTHEVRALITRLEEYLA